MSATRFHVAGCPTSVVEFGEFISLPCRDTPTAAQKRRAAALRGKHGDARPRPLDAAALKLSHPPV